MRRVPALMAVINAKSICVVVVAALTVLACSNKPDPIPSEIASFAPHLSSGVVNVTKGEVSGIRFSQTEYSYTVDMPLDDAFKQLKTLLVPLGYKPQAKRVLHGDTIAGFDNGMNHYELEDDSPNSNRTKLRIYLSSPTVTGG